MARWQFLDGMAGKPIDAPLYDDGDQVVPGDPGFSTAKVTAQMADVPGALGFNYVGQSAPDEGE